MSSLIRKKTIEDSTKDGLIITAKTTKIFFALNTGNVKKTKKSLLFSCFSLYIKILCM